MALVDYSSSDSDSESPRSEQIQDQLQHSPTKALSSTAATFTHALDSGSRPSCQPFAQPQPLVPPLVQHVSSALPPLPSTFHDLYASTVRTATADLPSLHQGRKRTIPHKDGNWPSHVYLEWHPTPSQRHLLQTLLAVLARDLTNLLGAHGLTGFVTSDMGAPLPLHVSLSRCFVLNTHEKDRFLDLVTQETERCRVNAFALACDHLQWHRSPDSERSFLVLRVRSASGNKELFNLLCVYNNLLSLYEQPRLYAPQGIAGGDGDGDEDSKHVIDAFHVSLAWSFSQPTTEIMQKTAEVFSQPRFREAILSGISIPVNGVKVKIGNVVTNIALPEVGRGSHSGSGPGLFGG